MYVSGQWCDQKVGGGVVGHGLIWQRRWQSQSKKSGREISLGFSAWASSMDKVTLLMFSSKGGYSLRDLSTLGEKSIENMF